MKTDKQLAILERIRNLDNETIQRLIRAAEDTALAIAMKGADKEIREKIFQNMSKRQGFILQANMDYMGPMRLCDVQNAEREIYEILKKVELQK